MSIQHNQFNNQPSLLEQVGVSTVQGLRQLEALLPYEFEETIYTIETFLSLEGRKGGVAEKPLSKEQLENVSRCPRHGCLLVMAEYKNPDAGWVCEECEDEAREAV